MNPRVLFILKYRENVDGSSSFDLKKGRGMSSGLANSARLVCDMLRISGIESECTHVVDNNDIDREVHRYKPTHAIIEALWVVPEKFAVLIPLHPKVKWIVRTHSEIPFLSNEGIAVDWFCSYLKYSQVSFAANSEFCLGDLKMVARSSGLAVNRVLYLPNFYPYQVAHDQVKQGDEFLDVACFGAVRPMKNHLIQAIAALAYANVLDKKLRFHVNATRVEQQGDSALKNLRDLFRYSKAQLVENKWLPHAEFLESLNKMDIGLQVSFSETFNIVAADMVVSGLPVVVSPEIFWASSQCQAEPTNTVDIIKKMQKAVDPKVKAMNLRGLKRYCDASQKAWLNYLRSHSTAG